MSDPSSAQPPGSPARDRAFWGLTLTQFLGAFNDNLFKQLVLLLCVDVKQATGTDFQIYAQAIFALPFVFLSGFAGYIADRYSKRTIVVLAKIAEIGIMLAGMLIFLGGVSEPRSLIVPLFIVLGFMSVQSAFFGPPKYGILPELFRQGDLPGVNGIVQMTTFLAIIFGMALAGIGKELLADRVWIVSAWCVGIAIVGTLTSLLVRRTPVAYPGLKFQPSMLGVHRSIRDVVRRDRVLLGALLVSSLFWFVGGVIQPAVNELGKNRLGLDDGRTSVMLAWMATGIAVGCAAAAKLSHHRINVQLITRGCWGIIASLLVVTWLGTTAPPPLPPELRSTAVESMGEMIVTAGGREWSLRLALASVGFFGGLFIVPLQVLIQTRPPDDLKGRMIGAMNLANWTAIVLSAVFFGIGGTILASMPQTVDGITYTPISGIFAALAVCLVPVAIWYRPRVD